MDLIYMSADKKELGILQKYKIDIEISKETGDNTFEIECALENNVLNLGYYIYTPDEEYGGRVDSVNINTEKDTITYTGRTWRAILGSKIIEPPEGEAYYIVSGDFNTILGEVIKKTDLDDLFEAETKECGISITNHKFNRYTDAYAGIIRMLKQKSAKLKLRWNDENGKMKISALPITDISADTEVSSEMFDFVIKKSSARPNHIIGLGTGQLTERQVVHKYIQEDGSVGDTKFYTGSEEITVTFEETNAESLESLTENTIERLEDLAIEDELNVTSYDLKADIGDKITASMESLGISVTQYVIDKIIDIDEDETANITYKVGDTL